MVQVRNARALTSQGADVESDHGMVMIDCLEMKPPNQQRIRSDLEKLSDRAFHTTISGGFEPLAMLIDDANLNTMATSPKR